LPLAAFEVQNMFGSIGFQELIIIMSIALLIFGPKKLPEVGRSIGKALREFRKTSEEIKEKIEEEIHAEEFRELKKDIEQTVDITGSSPAESENPYDFTDEPKNEAPPDTEEPPKDTEPHEQGKKVS
jgi:TatA/E family protein of Tat protein translocase